MARYRIKLGKNLSLSSKGLRVGGKIGKKGPYVSTGSSGTFIGGSVGPVRYSHFARVSTTKNSTSRNETRNTTKQLDPGPERDPSVVKPAVASTKVSFQPAPQRARYFGVPKQLRSTANTAWAATSIVFAIGAFSMLFNPNDRENTGVVPLLVWIAVSLFVAVWNLRAKRRKTRARQEFLKQRWLNSQHGPKGCGKAPATSPSPVSRFAPPLPPPQEQPLPTTPPPASILEAPSLPTCGGKPIYEVLDEVAALKRAGDLGRALAKAEDAMFAMAQAAAEDSRNVMDIYVIHVAMILHKMGNYEKEARTIQDWLDFGLPAPRPDFRADLRKRLAKAKEQWAKSEGLDSSEYTAEWKRLVAAHKAAQSEYRASAVAVSATGRSRIEGSQNYVRHRPRSASNTSAPNRRLLPANGGVTPEFVAVDFETANDDRRSACAIALVRIVESQVVERYTSILRPPSGLDYFKFTDIHGLTQTDVANAPQWRDIHHDILRFIGESPLWAHNAQFDRSVWHALDHQFETGPTPSDFYCSMELAKNTFTTLPNYKLPTVVQFAAPNFRLDHHNATSDAEACGLIVAEAARRLSR